MDQGQGSGPTGFLWVSEEARGRVKVDAGGRCLMWSRGGVAEYQCRVAGAAGLPNIGWRLRLEHGISEHAISEHAYLSMLYRSMHIGACYIG